MGLEWGLVFWELDSLYIGLLGEGWERNTCGCSAWCEATVAQDVRWLLCRRGMGSFTVGVQELA